MTKTSMVGGMVGRRVLAVRGEVNAERKVGGLPEGRWTVTCRGLRQSVGTQSVPLKVGLRVSKVTGGGAHRHLVLRLARAGRPGTGSCSPLAPSDSLCTSDPPVQSLDLCFCSETGPAVSVSVPQPHLARSINPQIAPLLDTSLERSGHTGTAASMSFVKRVRLVLVSSLGKDPSLALSRSSSRSPRPPPSPSVAYIAFLASLILEPVQTGLIYLHGLRFPHGTDFSRPELVGFAPGKVRPFNLTTPDGATLGAWHVLPRNAYEAAIERLGVPEEGPLPDEVFDEALRDPSTPTVTYNHGNAGTRAAGNRVRVARHMSDMDCNFLIIDYRGFADSSRSPPPSEEGLLIDARRAWDFLQVDKGVEAGNIAIMGQSLGTGVSAGLAARLAAEGITPRALVLVAPFSSIPTLLETYRLGASTSLSSRARTLTTRSTLAQATLSRSSRLCAASPGCSTPSCSSSRRASTPRTSSTRSPVRS